MVAMLVVFVIMAVCGVYLLEKSGSGIGFFLFATSTLGGIILCVSGFLSYLSHASDVGTIRGQNEVIAVYEERVASLEERLNGFNYPKNGGISLNADSPIASIVSSLTAAETELASAKRKKAEARVSIEQRKVGPYSAIVSLVGES